MLPKTDSSQQLKGEELFNVLFSFRAFFLLSSKRPQNWFLHRAPNCLVMAPCVCAEISRRSNGNSIAVVAWPAFKLAPDTAAKPFDSEIWFFFLVHFVWCCASATFLLLRIYYYVLLFIESERAWRLHTRRRCNNNNNFSNFPSTKQKGLWLWLYNDDDDFVQYKLFPRRFRSFAEWRAFKAILLWFSS